MSRADPGLALGLAEAEQILDMSGGAEAFRALGRQQLLAAVALQRMLLDQGAAYLADEVGMGKTYVAFAVAALFRARIPGFRVLYITPSRNVTEKWHGRELPAFLGANLREDFRREDSSAICLTVEDWAATARPAPLDTFLSFPALSFKLGDDAPACYARVKQLAEVAGKFVDLRGVSRREEFKVRAARIINERLPRYDLVVVDEAHLLRNIHSDRARFLATALGSTLGEGRRRRFDRVLFLSGTPYDRDLLQLARQFELLSRNTDRRALHRQVEALAQRREAGEDWDGIHEELRRFMIRRVQTLKVGDQDLSRNQYRVEWRKAAGISLAGDSGAPAVQQRLFAAMLQKRLIEHLDARHGGRFPLAMFSTWEAYPAPSAAARERESALDINEEHPLDAKRKKVDPHDEGHGANQALDADLIRGIVESHERLFGRPLPHPKLDHEVKRLAEDAFQGGEKQLVFVRRLKSVEDLYKRLNHEYNTWLSQHLAQSGVATEKAWKELTARLLNKQKPEGEAGVPAPEDEAPPPADGDEGPIPADEDTLFGFFFRGELTLAGKRFAVRHGLPAPAELRRILRDPERPECLVGELDWRSLLRAGGWCEAEVPALEVLECLEREVAKPATSRLEQYRLLQAAWLRCAARRCQGGRRRAVERIAHYVESMVEGKGASVLRLPNAADVARRLGTPTLYAALQHQGRLAEVLPEWTGMLARLEEGRTEAEATRQLQRLDLHGEILFALLRLSHPFVDLYAVWVQKGPDAQPREMAAALVEGVVRDFAAPSGRWGTAAILRLLGDGIDQVIKTNFMPLLDGSGKIRRAQWRAQIQRHLTPFSPVEWASGDNTEQRSMIARRFRMPGYPMVLISTSVLQEGEDLHVCCDRVTHFGISGSPVGIEQKNGRVDRIGSLAHRRLTRAGAVDGAAIQVRFPHLVETLEWYQIRDLAIGINDYLRSMHRMEKKASGSEQTLLQAISDRRPIPDLVQDRLSSPFEPEAYLREAEREG